MMEAKEGTPVVYYLKNRTGRITGYVTWEDGHYVVHDTLGQEIYRTTRVIDVKAP